MAQHRDARERVGREELGCRAAHALDARAHVSRDLGLGERPEADAERDPLPELAQRRIGQRGVELGLPGEDDLEDLLARRLQVGEEPELLEHIRPQVLGLVDEERDVAARLRVLEQELVEALEEDELATAFRRHAELEQGVLEDLVEADRGVQEQDRLGRGPDRVEQAAQQRRLPGAGVADQRDEALARLDPVAEGGERLLVAVVEVEEAWVGGNVEGGFAKPEVLGVHGGKPREVQALCLGKRCGHGAAPRGPSCTPARSCSGVWAPR